MMKIIKLYKIISKNWPLRGLKFHPLQLRQWVSLVGPARAEYRIFRGAHN
jgi:hypothetical protein